MPVEGKNRMVTLALIKEVTESMRISPADSDVNFYVVRGTYIEGYNRALQSLFNKLEDASKN